MRWIMVAMLVAACGKAEDPGPTCAQVTDHMLEVTKQQLVGHGDMVLGQRNAMIAQCESRTMPAQTRKCLVAAKTLDAIAACRAGKTDGSPTEPFEKPRKPRAPRGSATP